MDIGLTLTAFGAMMAGFYGIARMMLNQATDDRKADRVERHAFQKAIIKMAKSSDRVAEATENQAKESKQRNGHLAELILQGNNLVLKDIEVNRSIKKSLESSATLLVTDTADAAQHVAEVKEDLQNSNG